ncbi:MAG: hypothetical protein KIT34_05255 [Cyanobacteria bacterium TGS_CYA1]|nr:hypothetical protein [Cyanobacteria bacterium TGS_CYA1]
MSDSSNLPRAYVLLARKTPVGVIIRRGPSKQAQLILWHTDTDKFEPGQWIKARVYEKFCDLSPSGRYIVYPASKYSRGEGPQAWTAISRPPYFTALALWVRFNQPGGGLFLNDSELLVNHFLHNEDLEYGKGKNKLKVKCLNLEENMQEYKFVANRLLNNGWCEVVKDPSSVTPLSKTFYRSHSYANDHDLFLYLEFENRYSADNHSYLVCDKLGNVFCKLSNVKWADFDKNGDLLFSRNGKIFRLVHLKKAPYLPPIEQAKELLDLSNYEFELVSTPDWAKEW